MTCTTYVIIGILGFVGFVTFLTIINHHGMEVTFRDLRLYLTVYMRGGHHRNRLRLRDPATKRYIDFIKLILGKRGPTRYFMQLDSATCSADDFQRAQHVLQRAGVPLLITTEKDPHPPRLVVFCDLDVDLATRTALLMLSEVFGLDANTVFRAGCYGGFNSSPRKVIGWHRRREEVPERFDVPPEYRR